MAIDRDLAALLPEPPPARPARRESAIDEAMRRFDGHTPAPQPVPSDAEPARPRRWLAQHQFASLAAMALVALLSSSIWFSQADRFASPSPESEPRGGLESPLPAPPDAALAPTSGPPSATPPRADATAETETIDPAKPSTQIPAAPRAPSAEVAAAARAEPSESAIVVTGSRIQRPDMESASPVVSVTEAQLNRLPSAAAEQRRLEVQDDEQGIVVSGGARRSPTVHAATGAREAPGTDWSTCTVRDPARNIRACRRLADPAERDARGRAAAHLADGLSLAWEGNLDRAIEAFDRAIRTAPDLSLAYINRGLAYQMKGDLSRARADLDRAIAADPGTALGYYHRSQVRRASGDAAGAAADARRSAELASGS